MHILCVYSTQVQQSTSWLALWLALPMMSFFVAAGRDQYYVNGLISFSAVRYYSLRLSLL